MEKGPDKLTAYVFQAEFEMGVLIDRVMPGIKGQRTNRVALIVCDLVSTDHTRRVAGARGGNRSVKRHAGRVA